MPDNISKYNDSLTSSERSEQARAAGIESGRVRRARAQLLALSKSPAVMAYLSEHYDEETIVAMVDAIVRSAGRGNLNAIRFLISLEDDVNAYDPYADEEQAFSVRIINVDEEAKRNE